MRSRRRITAQVKVERRSATETRNRHGNPVYEYGAPEPVGVYSIAPATSSESSETGRPNSVVTGWTIHAPLDTQVSAYDRITLPDGTRTEVIGEVGRWERNPHAVASRLLRNEGVQITVQSTKG